MKACTQCGKCCQIYADGGLSASTKEIDQWEDERPDIYRYVSNGRIWADPVTGADLKSCPWLEENGSGLYTCSIYEFRPDDCRQYPVSLSDMARDGCEMLESQDQRDPARAQRKLDLIMSDVRPAGFAR
jgi:Fe-S-cluster containining protein